MRSVTCVPQAGTDMYIRALQMGRRNDEMPNVCNKQRQQNITAKQVEAYTGERKLARRVEGKMTGHILIPILKGGQDKIKSHILPASDASVQRANYGAPEQVVVVDKGG